MNWFSRLSVRAKLTAGFLCVAVISAVIGVVGLWSMQRAQELTEQVQLYEMPGLDLAGRLDSEYKLAGRALLEVLVASDPSVREEFSVRMRESFSDMDAMLQQLPRYFRSEQAQSLISRISQSLKSFQNGAWKAVEKSGEATFSARDYAYQILQRDAKPHGDTAEGLIMQLLEGKRNNARAVADEVDAVSTTSFVMSATITAIGVLVAILLGMLVSRAILRQLGAEPAEVAGVAEAIAKGDLTVKINGDNLPPHSIMAHMVAMRDALQRLVGSVLASSNSIAAGAGQIAAGNTDLSQRTEEQAANLTQTASAMEQLAGTVQSNADVARQAAQRAMAASRSAENGGEVVQNVVQTMAGINESSKRIVDIITVIDSIAFQTNILALNAAVEAARAGEQGRGFAVVAGEVRSLAQKSAAAAKDIKELIDESVQKVEDGSKLVDTAGETMAGIVADVKQVTDLISEISAATSEQTMGISQVNDAVLQLSDVTQQNAALVEESAAASASLNDQAQKLVELVQAFRIEASQASENKNRPQVISVPPATIEEGVRRQERPATSAYRGNGKAAASGGAATAETAAAQTAASRPAPALGGAKPALATAGVTAAAGGSLYGSGVSREDDWEEF